MVVAENTDTRTGPPRHRRPGGWLIGLVLAAVAVATMVVAVLTAPEPTAEPVAITTVPLLTPSTAAPFDVSQVAVGTPFLWQETLRVPARRLLGMVEHDGQTYVFTDAGGSRLYGPNLGMEGWVTTGGGSFEKLGPPVIGHRHEVSGVRSTPMGLLAYGVERISGQPVVWISENGRSWQETMLPTDPEAPSTINYWFNGAAGGDDFLVVSAVVSANTWDALYEPLSEEYGPMIDRYGFDQPDSETVTVRGPLGLAVDTIGIDELGLTIEDQTEVSGSPGTQEIVMWSTGDGVSWERRVFEDYDWIESLFPTNDGQVAVATYGATEGTYTTADGVNWVRADATAYVTEIRPWRERLVGVDWGTPYPHLLVSDGLTGWTRLETPGVFPTTAVTGFNWELWPVGVGDAGIAVALHAYEWRQTQTPEPVRLERNGLTLVVDDTGVLTIERGDTTVNRVPTWSYEQPGNRDYEIDPDTQTVTFHHPLTGEDLFTFTFSELDEAQRRLWEGDGGTVPVHAAFMFTGDGLNWSIQDFSEFGVIDTIHVSDNEVYLAQTYPGDSDGPHLQVWTGVRSDQAPPWTR